MPPRIDGILETPVYVDDLDVAYRFYHGILGLEQMLHGDRIHAYSVAPRQVLIACLRGACDADSLVGGAMVPGHRADGPGHFAFRIAYDALEAWIAHLEAEGVTIESQVNWPMGGKSFYFRDPFDNVVELATAGVWPNDPLEKD